MHRKVAVRGIVVHDGKLLLVRLKDYKAIRVLPAENWCTPGGGVDPGEPLIPALEREMVEETGVKPVVGNLLYVQQFVHKGQEEQLEFFFNILNSQDYLEIDVSKTSHGAIEIEEIGFKDASQVAVLPKFLGDEQFDNLDINAPTKFFNFI